MKKLQLTYGYDDVTLVPAYSELTSRSLTSPEMHGFNLPIIASCMDTLGVDLMECVIKNNIPFIAHRAFKSAEEQFNYFIKDRTFTQPFERYERIWWAVGSSQKYANWIIYLYNQGVRKFCIDMAHGDSKACIDTIKFIRKLDADEKQKAKKRGETLFSLCGQDEPTHIIAGNVATAEGFKRLQAAGANGIRIGIASGQICSTALNTGFGVPILTNIIECKKVQKHGTWIIADGGVKSTGDIAKAVYFGADFCMIGKLFAATGLACGRCFNKRKEEISNTQFRYDHDEEYFHRPIYPWEAEEVYKMAEELDDRKKDGHNRVKTVLNNIVAYKEYHGMASRDARKNVLSYASVEGVAGLVKLSGKTEDFINDTKLRLQASLSYAGAKNWNEFRKNTYAVMRSNAGIIAADTHLDVTLDK